MTANFENIVDEGVYDPDRTEKTMNFIPRSLQEKLRKRQIPFDKSEAYLKRLNEAKKEVSEQIAGRTTGQERRPADQERDSITKTDDMKSDVCVSEMEGEKQHSADDREAMLDESSTTRDSPVKNTESSDAVEVHTCGPLTDQDVVKLKADEKKKVQYILKNNQMFKATGGSSHTPQ